MEDRVKLLINNLLQALFKEKEAEQEIYMDEMRNMSGLEREKRGRTLVQMKKKSLGQTITGHWLYRFYKKNGSNINDTQIDVGDQVILSQYSPLDKSNPVATVYEVNTKTITLATNFKLRMSGARDIRIDLFVNDLTYMRMQEALNKLKSPRYSRLHSILSGNYAAEFKRIEIKDDSLNESQLDAISNALGNNGFYSIQGPPGTGKTYTVARLIENLVRAKQKILVCADSNAAVDNMIRKLSELGLDPLRIGNPIRVNKDLKKYTLDYKIVTHAMFKEIEESKKELDKLNERHKTLEKPNPKFTMSMSYEEIFELIDKKKGTAGIPRKALNKMRPWIKSYMKIEMIHKQIAQMRENLERFLLDSHQIVATTNVSSGIELLENEHFDWVIMDEAAQASIPSSMIPLLKCDRFVLVGDHYQLPPVVISPEAIELGLRNTLMEMLGTMYPYQMKMLDTQYRMNEVINHLISSMFYRSELKSDLSVKRRYLKVLGDEIISLYQVDGVEIINADSKSYYNETEAQKVKEVVEELLSSKYRLEQSQIGVITPYKAQVKYLKSILPQAYTDLEVDTVDSFQGREKDVIILSLVRSNEEGKIGFLKEYRRLNVSMSRAKCKLIIIANIEMIAKEPLYEKMFSKIKKMNSMSDIR